MAGNAFRIALALTLVTTLGLAGCGRKGKLEPAADWQSPSEKQAVAKP